MLHHHAGVAYANQVRQSTSVQAGLSFILQLSSSVVMMHRKLYRRRFRIQWTVHWAITYVRTVNRFTWGKSGQSVHHRCCHMGREEGERISEGLAANMHDRRETMCAPDATGVKP